MRRILALVGCVTAVGFCALFAGRDDAKPVPFRLSLVDEKGQRPAGIVRILAKDSGKPIVIPGLVDRLRGFKVPDGYTGWHVLPADGAEISLPRGAYVIEAVSGLETAKAVLPLNITGPIEGSVKVPLATLFRPEEKNLVAGNTHLHLMKITRKQADEYLRTIPAADRLKVLFISYLERKPDDKDYVTNGYPIGDLPEFDATGVLMNNGEEHRHNFKAYGQGYGHVMFLNIKKLVQPVSIGAGIMEKGFDDTPLKPGIEDARGQKGTVIWCHNTNGYEDVLNAVAGRLDALNVFDGSRTGDYESNYYRYLNVGLRLPLTTGTDWFMYDFSRVYAELPGKEKLTIPAWLGAVKAGKCQATNGPLLGLRVDDQGIGGTLTLAKPRQVKIEARGMGRHDFGKLELVFNGKVIATRAVTAKKAPYQTTLTHEMLIDEPGWFALRVSASERNEFGQVLFAHTSPIYVDLPGTPLFHVDDALVLLKQIEEGAAAIRAQGMFSTPKAQADLLGLYDQGASELRERVARARKK